MQLHSKASKRAESTFKNLEIRYNTLHNSKYDYSKSIYLNSKTKMCIICPTHGEFWQCHNKHYNAKQGCPSCFGKSRKTKEKFIEEAKLAHGDRYDYSKVIYKNQYTKVVITCPDHGEFEQIPTNHLAGKCCLKCSVKERGENHRLPFKEFLVRANKIHNFRYSYKNYVKASGAVTITCSDHGDFTQEATGHLQGKGCPKCGKYGFQFNSPAVLYYLKINNGKAYKIGVTNRSITERFCINELNKIEKVFTLKFTKGKEAYALEQKILKIFRKYNYLEEPILSSGNTELFTKDIFTGNTFKSIKELKEFLNEY